MQPAAPTHGRQWHRRLDARDAGQLQHPARRGAAGSTSSLELMALTPMLALLVLFILWAGRAGRAELVTSLAAEEAAVAAALCCNSEGTADPAAAGGSLGREATAEAVISSRPGLDYLCLGGPQPAAGTAGYVTAAEADLSGPDSSAELAGRVLVVTAHVTCETDGAIAPVRGLFGTRTLHGHGAHVAAFARTTPLPQSGPDPETSGDPDGGLTPDNLDGRAP